MGRQNHEALQYRILLTVEQAGLLLGVGKQKIQQFIDSGEIGAVLKFGSVRIPKFELERFLEKNLMRKKQ